MNESQPQPLPEHVEPPYDVPAEMLSHENIDMLLERQLVLERQARLAALIPTHELLIHNQVIEDFRQSYGNQKPNVDSLE